jgi:hypothetical protein
MLFQINPSIETVTYIITAAFSCFTIYKTIQFFNSPILSNQINSDLGSVSGSPTIKSSELINSVESTISSNTIPLPIPNPLPLPIPNHLPSDTITHVLDRAVDGSIYVFAVLGDISQTINPEFINVFM